MQDKVRAMCMVCSGNSAPQPESWNSYCGRGLRCQKVALGTDPGGQLLAVKEQPEGTGVRNSTTGKVYRKSQIPQKEGVIVEAVCKGQASHHSNALPHSLILPQDHCRGHPSKQAHLFLKARPLPPMQSLGSCTLSIPKPSWESCLRQRCQFWQWLSAKT